MGVGSLSMIVPMYNAEVAPPEVRGSLIALQQLAICFGIMISFWIDYGTNYIGGTGQGQSEAAWLLPICLQLFPAVVLFAGILFMPFSPRWLVHHDREAEARKVLATLRGLPQDHELVELEFLEIKAQSLFEKRTVAEHWPNLRELTTWNIFKLQFVAIGSLFRTRAMFKRVIVATVTMFFQQWTGINAILYYAPTIFASLGLSSNTVSLLATGVVGIVMFIATIPSVLYIDKLGRKPILTVGAIGMATCHIIVAVVVAKNRDQWETHKSAGWAAIVMVWLFVIHFGYSWGPCAWIIVAEIWPLSNRPYGIALGASSNWMNNFIVGQVRSSRPFQCTANAERPLGNTRHDLRNLLRHLPNLRNPNLHRCSIHLVFRP
jgi:MFS family permease